VVVVRSSAGVLAGLLLVVVTGACGSDDDSATSPSSQSSTTMSATTTTVSESTTQPTTAPCPPLSGGTQGVTTGPSASGSANLQNAQLTSGDCTDVVTFTFAATTADAPGYRVEYRPGPVIRDPSGETETVAGTAYLFVRFEPAYGYDINTGQSTYTGPKRLPTTGALFVKDVVETGDFEAVMNWVIGVDQMRDYTVSTTGTSTRTVTIEVR
jgi:hypothetical protein